MNSSVPAESLCSTGDARATECMTIAISLRAQYQTTWDEDLLERTIKLEREALTLRPRGHVDRGKSCVALASSLWNSYNRNGDENLLTESINLNREAFDLHPPGHPERRVTCASLALSLGTRYDNIGENSLLDETIALERESLSLHPHGHPDRARSCSNLAASLLTSYRHTGHKVILAESIDLSREALVLGSAGHPKRRYACQHLALSLETAYKHTGDRRLLDEAINLEREVLKLCPPGHPEHHFACSNLAVSLQSQYHDDGNESILTEIVELHRKAVQLCPSGHPNRDSSCEKLASTLSMVYRSTAEESLLTESIELNREALRLRPPGHPNRSTSCVNLAVSLRMRFDQTGDKNLLSETIHLEREALSLRPSGHPDQHATCSNLAATLAIFYTHSRDDVILAEAMELNRKALSLCPPGHPDRGRACINLAISLGTRYQRTGKASLLIEAINLEREVLGLHPPGHPGHPASCLNLAGSLLASWGDTDYEGVLSEAVDLYIRAAGLLPAPDQWRSAIKLSRIHSVQQTEHYDMALSIRYLMQSLQHEPSDLLAAITQITSVLDLYWNQSIKDMPQDARSSLVVVYGKLIALLPLISNPVFDLKSQLQRLRKVHQVGADAFVNAVLAGKHTVGLEHLEIAQGIIWAQRLHQRDPQLEDVPRAQAAELESCLQALRSRYSPADLELTPEQTFVTSRDDLHKYSSRMYSVIRKIRTLPGLEHFMLGESYEDLCSVSMDHPVVVLVGSRGHFYALVIASGRICGPGGVPLRLDVTDQDLTAVSVYGQQSTCRGDSAHVNPDNDQRGVQLSQITPPLSRYLRMLWLKVVKPVLNTLKLSSSTANRPRLHWCPTGPFASAPLHAAGIYNGEMGQTICCADFVVSSYTPTLTALLRSQRSCVSLAREDIHLILLAAARTQEQLPTIPGAFLELDAVKAIAASRNVNVVGHRTGSTTVAGASEAIQAANIIHFACHGVQDHEDATRSGFCLGDGRLAISNIIQVNIKQGFLAFLSACETARGSDEQPDQAMHLAAAMLFTGFNNVIATMWAISDKDGPKVAEWFYKELFDKEIMDAAAVADALDNAVRKLRESGVPTHRWVPFIHMGA